MPPAIQFSIDNFRLVYKAYSNPITYPDQLLSASYVDATCYVSDQNGGCFVGGMNNQQRAKALNLMTAHLLAIGDLIAAGYTPGVVTAATIDKVSVTLQPPPVKNQWQQWLQTTPYGQQLLALLQLAAAGGTYLSIGLPARAGLRS